MTPGVDDFRFRVGNDEEPDSWPVAPSPSVLVFWPGEGVGGSDRITLIWPDHAIQKQWLQVTVLATEATGLAEEDVFYFGNAIAETGNSATDAKVNAFDMLAARDNQRNFLNPAPIDFAYDFNRDARVNSVDMLIARNNQTHFLNALKLITAPGGAKTGAPEPGPEVHPTNGPAWLYEYEPEQVATPDAEKDKPVAAATDETLTAYRA